MAKQNKGVSTLLLVTMMFLLISAAVSLSLQDLAAVEHSEFLYKEYLSDTGDTPETITIEVVEDYGNRLQQVLDNTQDAGVKMMKLHELFSREGEKRPVKQTEAEVQDKEKSPEVEIIKDWPSIKAALGKVTSMTRLGSGSGPEPTPEKELVILRPEVKVEEEEAPAVATMIIEDDIVRPTSSCVCGMNQGKKRPNEGESGRNWVHKGRPGRRPGRIWEESGQGNELGGVGKGSR